MKVSRRRFLTLSAAFAFVPAGARAQNWTGRAFGANVSLTIKGPRDLAQAAVTQARQIIQETEALFSLYDPNSALSRLNATGQLMVPDPRFVSLMKFADDAYAVTGGLFDPTVQSLWLSRGVGQRALSPHIGWKHIRFNKDGIHLEQGQSLTFNGIAQGYATDLVTQAFAALGLTDVLVNIGEYRGIGGPWRLAVQDPTHGDLGNRTLKTGAIATSSPQATVFGGNGHILHPSATPEWSTVSVEAQTATLADSLSTAMVLASRKQIDAILAQSNIGTKVAAVTLIDKAGDLITL